MFNARRRARFQNSKNRRARMGLKFEQLEERRVLSVSSPPAMLSLDALQIDPDSYDEASIIVRFHDGLNQTVTTTDFGLGPHVITGTQIRSQLGDIAGLHQVGLSRNISVEEALTVYRQDPRVAYAEPNYRVRIADTYPNDSRYGEMWALNNVGQTGGQNDADIDARRAWDVGQGSGSTIVAVIDTGVDYTHPDLAGNMWSNPGEIPGDGLDNDNNGYVDDVHGYDFINRDSDPMDDHGHGTHVAGTIGAEGNNSLGIAGINWNVQIMALKFIGPDGWGDMVDAIEAIQYAMANGADITNASWGGDPYSVALFDTIAAGRDTDHIFVAAAGNGNELGIGQDNDAILYYPASYDLDNIVAVSATDDNDRLASFSNYGHTTVDLAAPGVDILSTTPGGGYGLNSGTSMAAPHASGVLALVRDLHPEWTYLQVIEQVLTTVDTLPELYGLNATGGRLNMAAAVGNPEPLPPPPPAGALPVYEDFQDGTADYWLAQAGSWDVGGGRYTVTPLAENHDLAAVSKLDLALSLPDHFEIATTFSADEGRLEVFGWVFKNHLTNGFVVFDYHTPEDFKFAGADMVEDRWVIGHRDANGWTVDAWAGEVLNAGTNYPVRVTVQNGNAVQLEASGTFKVLHNYDSSITDGDVGLGMRDSSAHFDNVRVQAIEPDTTGPRLVTEAHVAAFSPLISTFRVVFDEPIDTGTFTREDVEFFGPAGPVAVTDVLAVAGSGNREFDVSFPLQSELGTYNLILGPEILDLSGNRMNQDGDSVNGETIDDRGTTSFRIVPYAIRLDFGKVSSPVAPGYTRVVETDLYNAATGYGWQQTVSSWDRATEDNLLRDFHYSSAGTFLADLPNGEYEVWLTMGDEGGAHDQMSVALEDVHVDTITTQAGQYITDTYLLYVTDGQLTLQLTDLGGSNANFVINALEVISTGPDETLPQVDSASPAGSFFGTLEHFELTFSEPIDSATFTADDVTLTGPGGAVSPLAVTRVADDQFNVTFAPQIALGNYQLVVGPEIADAAGNELSAPVVTDISLQSPPDVAIRLDFGKASTPVAAGYNRVIETDLYNATKGFGWQQAVSSWDRGTADALLRDFHFAAAGTFLVDVPNGQYEVVLTMGDEGGVHDQVSVSMEDSWVDTISTVVGQYVTNTYQVNVYDGQLTVALTDLGGSNANFVINALEVLATGPDLVPPEVIAVSPSGNFFGTLEAFELTFSEPIDAATFSVDDAVLTGPGGTVHPLSVTPLAEDRYQVTFAPQDALGNYQLVAGPQIADSAGNELPDPLIVDVVLEPAPNVSLHLDFGKTLTPVASGYSRVIETDLYNATTGYGWQQAVSSWDRATGDALLRDFHFASQGTFLVDVPSGQYEVVLTMGDEGGLHDQVSVTLEGTSVDNISTAAGEYVTRSYQVNVTDSQLTLQLTDLGGSNANFVINALEVLATGPDQTAPAVVNVSPSGSIFDTLEHFELTFSEPIDAATFASDDVTLSGPNGLVSPLEVHALEANRFQVTFAPQTTRGAYQLVVGPQIADTAGNELAAPLIVEVTLESPPAVAIRLDFGKASTPVASDYSRVIETDLYSTTTGYGWQQAVSSWDRATSDALLRDFHYAKQGTFLIDVPNGQYQVVLTMGDEGGLHDQMRVTLENVTVDTITTLAGQYVTNAYLINVLDGQLTVQLTDLGGSNANFVINALEVLTTGPDQTAPALVAISPSGTIINSLEHFALTFSEPIDAATFTAEDVTLTGPSGTVSPLSVTPLAGDQFQVTFPPQDVPGVYQLVVGPQIADTAGNNMDAPLIADIVVAPMPELAYRFDFGKASTPVAVGYTAVVETDLYNATKGYGWQQTVFSWDRATADALLRDFHYAGIGTFLVDVPNGQYQVVLTMGDEGGVHDEMRVTLEGTAVDTVTTAAGEYITNVYVVDVNDGQLTLRLTDVGGTNGNFVVNALEILPQTAVAGLASLDQRSALLPDTQSAGEEALKTPSLHSPPAGNLEMPLKTEPRELLDTDVSVVYGERLMRATETNSRFPADNIGVDSHRKRLFTQLGKGQIDQLGQYGDLLDLLAGDRNDQ